ncbi:hypothetical protein ABZP36_023911 [Zizania latifolia]
MRDRRRLATMTTRRKTSDRSTASAAWSTPSPPSAGSATRSASSSPNLYPDRPLPSRSEAAFSIPLPRVIAGRSAGAVGRHRAHRGGERLPPGNGLPQTGGEYAAFLLTPHQVFASNVLLRLKVEFFGGRVLQLFVEYAAEGRPLFGLSLGLLVDCLNTSVPGHAPVVEIRYPGPDMQLLLGLIWEPG